MITVPVSADARFDKLCPDVVGHPLPPGPLAAVVVHAGSAWVSGQPPSHDGEILFAGRIGDDDGVLSVEDGYRAARLCTSNCLAALRAELGSLDRIARIIKVTGFVQAASGFAGHSKVVNGASELLVEVFGEEQGRHARSAVGMSSLPGNMAVEVEMVVALTVGDG